MTTREYLNALGKNLPHGDATDGNHVSKDGKVISKDCNSCHTVIEQQESGTQIASLPAQPFKHPVDIGDLTGVNCSDCHSGGVGP